MLALGHLYAQIGICMTDNRFTPCALQFDTMEEYSPLQRALCQRVSGTIATFVSCDTRIAAESVKV